MENNNSLFADFEYSEHRVHEYHFLNKAKQGYFNELFEFWKEKRKIFMKRADERLGNS